MYTKYRQLFVKYILHRMYSVQYSRNILTIDNTQVCHDFHVHDRSEWRISRFPSSRHSAFLTCFGVLWRVWASLLARLFSRIFACLFQTSSPSKYRCLPELDILPLHSESCTKQAGYGRRDRTKRPWKIFVVNYSNGYVVHTLYCMYLCLILIVLFFVVVQK